MPVNPIALPPPPLQRRLNPPAQHASVGSLESLDIDWQTIDPQTSPLQWLTEYSNGRAAMAGIGVLLERMNTHAILDEPARRLVQLWQRLGFTGMDTGSHRTFRFDPASHLKSFAKATDAHDITKLLMRICHQTAVALDRIAPGAADNPATQLALQALCRDLSNAFEDHTACGPGVLSRLQDCLLHGLALASDRSIARTVTTVRDKLFDEAVTHFYLKKPLFNGESVQIRIGNQIHYRNAARNVIGSDFQISNPFEDRFALNHEVNFDLPSGLRQQIDSALQAHCVARSLATAYLNDLGELHGGWQQDYARLTARIREAQSTQLDAAFGPVDRLDYLLTLADDGLTVSPTKDSDLLAVHLYRNAEALGAVAPLDAKASLTFETGGKIRRIMIAGPLVWSEPLLSNPRKNQHTDRCNIPIEPVDTQEIGCWLVAEKQQWLNHFIAPFTTGQTDLSMLAHNRRTGDAITNPSQAETTIPRWLLDALKYGIEQNPQTPLSINPSKANPKNLVVDTVCRFERVLSCETLTPTDRHKLIDALATTVRDDILNHYVERSTQNLNIPQSVCCALVDWLISQERYVSATKILKTNLAYMSPATLATVACRIPESMRIAICDLFRDKLLSAQDDASFEHALSTLRHGHVSPVTVDRPFVEPEDVSWLSHFATRHGAQRLGMLARAIRDGIITKDTNVRERAGPMPSSSVLSGTREEDSELPQTVWNELLRQTIASLGRPYRSIGRSHLSPQIASMTQLYGSGLKFPEHTTRVSSYSLTRMPLLEAVNTNLHSHSSAVKVKPALSLTRRIMKAIMREPDAATLKRLLDDGDLSIEARGREIGSRHDKTLLEFARSYGAQAAIDMLEQRTAA